MKKIPGYKLSIFKNSRRSKPVYEKVFLDGPGDGEHRLADYRYGQGEWENIRARQKTYEGLMNVIVRDGGNKRLFDGALAPGEKFKITVTNGETYVLLLEEIKKSEWKAAPPSIKIKAPRFEIEGRGDGWILRYTVREKPCVLTCAVDAKRIKDQSLPSFPFPKDVKANVAEFFVPKNNDWGIATGQKLRLGVRGAGLQAMIEVPPLAEGVKVGPRDFKKKGPCDETFLKSSYVSEKYQEKNGIIRYLQKKEQS